MVDWSTPLTPIPFRVNGFEYVSYKRKLIGNGLKLPLESEHVS